jgi:hypothetical protein
MCSSAVLPEQHGKPEAVMQVVAQLAAVHNIWQSFELQRKQVDTCLDVAMQRLRSSLHARHAANSLNVPWNSLVEQSRPASWP